MLTLLLSLCESAFAHGGHHHESVAPAVFVFKWPLDPTLFLFLAMAICYARGLRAYGGHAPVRRWQKVSFFTGVAVLVLAYLPPVDPVSDQLFSMHMAQHLMITSIGVPLMVLGAPFLVSVRGLPIGFRQGVFVPFAQSRGLRSILRWGRRPIVAAILYEAVFWFWHVPKFYNLALLNDAIHLVEHGCMALAALNLWRILIDPPPLRSPLAPPLRIVLLLVMATLDMALSAALTYSQSVWYAYDRLPLPSWWGWNRLEDQRLGGVIMWVPGGMVWMIAVIVIFVVWARRESAHDFPSSQPSRAGA